VDFIRVRLSFSKFVYRCSSFHTIHFLVIWFQADSLDFAHGVWVFDSKLVFVYRIFLYLFIFILIYNDYTWGKGKRITSCAVNSLWISHLYLSIGLFNFCVTKLDHIFPRFYVLYFLIYLVLHIQGRMHVYAIGGLSPHQKYHNSLSISSIYFVSPHEQNTFFIYKIS
jgi:hypothetical protein